MSERPSACKHLEQMVECTCDVPFIGNFAEADRRIHEGTLTGVWDDEHRHWIVTARDIREALTRVALPIAEEQEGAQHV